jgi:hypothetical protein
MAIEITFGGSGNDPLAIPSAAYTKTGQGFQDADGFTMESIGLSFSLAAGDPGTVYVELYAADGSGYPTGPLLTSTNFAANTLASYPSFTYKTLSLATTISAATQYVVVVYTSAGTHPTSYIYVKATITNPYADGIVVRYNGAAWSQHSSYDFTGTIRSADVPGKATVPAPADDATGVSSNIANLTWTAGANSTDENVYFGASEGGLALVESGNTSESYDMTTHLPLSPGTEYFWRIDSVDSEDDVTTGDVWSFTTLAVSPPAPATWQQLKRLVACADNRFWFEDI